MKVFGWPWLVTSSLIGRSPIVVSMICGSVIVGSLAASAETRPQYGGTLHVAVRAPSSLNSPDCTQPNSFASRNLALLIFETLVTTDDGARVRPALATSWQESSGGQRWQFRLRRGVKFHDGTAFTSEVAASALRNANPSWSVIADADSVTIESDTPDPVLPLKLALACNAVAKKTSEGKLSGTGPFHIVDWQPGKKLSLAAEENYWGGRPFLDAIEIELGKNFHDQLIALELGRADLVEVAPEQSHRISTEGRRVVSSAPMELVALLFTRDGQSADDRLLREALAFSVDRASIRSVLLQGVGQPAGSILPNWMSGYGFVFSTEADLPRARHQREQVHNVPEWTMGYDTNDSIARLLVERVALNAKDAGLTLRLTTATAADLRLVRIPLAAADPWISLENFVAAEGLPKPKINGSSAEDLYSAEQAALANQRLIPLFHLPATYGASTILKNWAVRSDGSWDLAGAWLGSAKP
jgi:peptide/nickel transport system substrate-binding protein